MNIQEVFHLTLIYIIHHLRYVNRINRTFVGRTTSGSFPTSFPTSDSVERAEECGSTPLASRPGGRMATASGRG